MTDISSAGGSTQAQPSHDDELGRAMQDHQLEHEMKMAEKSASVFQEVSASSEGGQQFKEDGVVGIHEFANYLAAHDVSEEKAHEIFRAHAGDDNVIDLSEWMGKGFESDVRVAVDESKRESFEALASSITDNGQVDRDEFVQFAVSEGIAEDAAGEMFDAVLEQYSSQEGEKLTGMTERKMLDTAMRNLKDQFGD